MSPEFSSPEFPSPEFPAWTVERTIESDLGQGHAILEELLAKFQSEDWSSRDIFGIRLALEEAIVNAIKHGNRLAPDKQVTVICRSTPEKIWIRIADQGQGFNPDAVPDCTAPQNIGCPNGRGIMLMRNYMTCVEYSESGRVVMMEKLRTSES